MKPTSRGSGIRKLLDTCNDLQQIRSKMSDPELEHDTLTKLRRQSKRKADQLTRDLDSYRFDGPFAELTKSFLLVPEHFQILAVLLQRQVRCEEPAIEGRLLLAEIFESTYEVLSRADLLHSDDALRASGLMVLEDDADSPEDTLEARFVLSEQGLEAFRYEIVGARHGRAADRLANPEPYANNRAFLIDLRVVHNLHKQRADRVFSVDRWHRLHNSSFAPGTAIDERISACWRHIESRLEATEDPGSFPAVRLMREYHLDRDEVVMVVHLLFKELYEGNAYADVAELLKLVSHDESDLIRNRRLVADKAALRVSEMLMVEPMLEGRVLTAEAYLSDWVINFAFGATNADENIRADERIDWHVYLNQMDDTQSFFRDLDSN